MSATFTRRRRPTAADFPPATSSPPSTARRSATAACCSARSPCGPSRRSEFEVIRTTARKLTVVIESSPRNMASAPASPRRARRPLPMGMRRRARPRHRRLDAASRPGGTWRSRTSISKAPDHARPRPARAAQTIGRCGRGTPSSRVSMTRASSRTVSARQAIGNPQSRRHVTLRGST